MKRQKRRNSSNKIENLTQSILAILRKDHSNPHNYKQLASKLGVDDPSSRNHVPKSKVFFYKRGFIVSKIPMI